MGFPAVPRPPPTSEAKRGGEAVEGTLLEWFSSERGKAGNSLTQPSCVLEEAGKCGEVP